MLTIFLSIDDAHLWTDFVSDKHHLGKTESACRYHGTDAIFQSIFDCISKNCSEMPCEFYDVTHKTYWNDAPGIAKWF